MSLVLSGNHPIVIKPKFQSLLDKYYRDLFKVKLVLI